MAIDSLVKTGKKLNNRKSGAKAAKQLRKRTEAEARNAKYAAIPIAQKLVTAGAKEKAKLLAKAAK
jgi:hypothetical protein